MTSSPLPAILAEPATEGVRPAVAALVAAAQTAWAGILTIDDHVFTAHVADRVPADATDDAIARLHGTDLFLACGCASGLAPAVAAFEVDLMGDVRALLQRMRLQPAAVDDLAQTVREKVLIGDAGKPPKIAEYSGRGALRAWLRVVATRIALNALRDAREDAIGEIELDAAAPSVANPELSYLRERHGRDLQLALEQALQSLTSEQRALLRQHFVEGLSCPQIAKLRGVHPVTILRRLQRVLEDLRNRTIEGLQANLGCEPAAADSVIRLAVGHLAPGIQRYLAPTTRS